MNKVGQTFIGTLWNGIYKLDYNGKVWIQNNNDLYNSSISALVVSPNGDIYAGMSTGGFFRSTDNGGNWTEIDTGLANNNVNSLAVNSMGVIFAGTAGGGVFYSVSQGDSWTALNNGLLSLNITSIAISPEDYIFAGTSGDGIYFRAAVLPVELSTFTAAVNKSSVNLLWSTATEKNNAGFEIDRLNHDKNSSTNDNVWTKIGFVKGSGTSVAEHSYSFTDNTVKDCNYLYRIKQIDYNGSCSYSNEIEVDVLQPTNYELGQNFPNPFNPSTTINYQLPQNSPVTLIIYNSIGKEIKTLVNEFESTGRYSVKFNAANIASGIYFYRLRAGNFISTKKMLLLK